MMQIFEDTEESHYQFSGPASRVVAKKENVPFVPVETKRELYRVRSSQVKQGEQISAKLAPGGGHCLIFKPLEAE